MHHPSNPSTLVSADELQYFDCRVEAAGPGEDGTIWVFLTDTAGKFSQVWFTASHPIRQQVLETALAALQSQLDCHIGVLSTDDGSQIYRIHAYAMNTANRDARPGS
jgi:hypothetical protein